MIDNIKNLMAQANNKTTAIQAVADKCGKKFAYVKSWWLAPSGGFSIPEAYQEAVVDVLQKVIQEQEAKKMDVVVDDN